MVCLLLGLCPGAEGYVFPPALCILKYMFWFQTTWIWELHVVNISECAASALLTLVGIAISPLVCEISFACWLLLIVLHLFVPAGDSDIIKSMASEQ